MSVQTRAFIPHTATAEINITPLIDVMLALLLIFMLAAPVIAQRIALPIAPSDAKTRDPRTLELAIGDAGTFTLDGVALSPSLLDAQLRVTVAAGAPVALKIRSSAGAPYASLTSALAAARNAGIDTIGIEAAR